MYDSLLLDLRNKKAISQSQISMMHCPPCQASQYLQLSDSHTVCVRHVTCERALLRNFTNDLDTRRAAAMVSQLGERVAAECIAAAERRRRKQETPPTCD
jgi:hypothetical protein